MVRKIESMEWRSIKDRIGDGVIDIELRDLFEPHLLGTTYCDRITIWWNSSANEYEESVRIYAMEKNSEHDSPLISKVKPWYEPELIEALKWIQENLT